MGRGRQVLETTAVAFALAATLFWWGLLFPTASVGILVGSQTLAIPPVLIPLIGVVSAGLVQFLIRIWVPRTRPEATLTDPERTVAAQLGPVLGVTVVATALLLGLALDKETIRPEVAALLLVFATITLLAASYALEALVRGQSIEVTSHWGGLGGGLGGWRLSSPAMAALLGLSFLAATIGVVAFSERGNAGGGGNNVTAIAPAPKQQIGTTPTGNSVAPPPAGSNAAAATGTR